MEEESEGGEMEEGAKELEEEWEDVEEDVDKEKRW